MDARTPSVCTERHDTLSHNNPVMSTLLLPRDVHGSGVLGLLNKRRKPSPAMTQGKL